MRSLLFVLAFLGLAAGLGTSAVINVPGDYSTIQEAILNATGGDIVEVEPGTYTENIDFTSKGITVRSTLGPYRTVIDGGGTGSVVRINKNEPPSAVLEGFRITNGVGTLNLFDGAISGGGIFCKGTSPKLRDLLVTENRAVHGGGIYTSGGTLLLENVSLDGNTADVAGGGLFVDSGIIQLDNCSITNNVAEMLDGGGIYTYDTEMAISDSRILGNSSGYWGGGIAGLFALDLSLVNTVFAHNTAAISGGGVALIEADSLAAVNATFFDNEAVLEEGGGILLSRVGVAEVVNTILWNDKAPLGPEISIDQSTLELNYCDVEGGSALINIVAGSLNYGAGNISVQPIFVDETLNDFHLFHGSGGIDAGNNNATGLPEKDIEGDARINDGTVDMGADEYYSSYMYFSGVTMEGMDFSLNFIGTPNANPVYIYIGSGVLPAPIPTLYGDWYLVFPVKPIQLFPLPASGFISYSMSMPSNLIFPPGTTFPFQTLLGPELTPVAFMTLK